MLTKNPNKELMAFIAETEDISLVEGTAIPTGVDFKKDETLIRLPVEVCKILRERYPKDVGCPSATLSNRLSQDFNVHFDRYLKKKFGFCMLF